MVVHINNSLTNKKEALTPVSKKIINMYSCGVTVYDSCHIGHARSLYTFEVIRRYLKYRGYKVNFIRNITDIDDKIINKANELKKDWKQVVQDNIDAYQKDLEDLGVGQADQEPTATDNIDEIISFIGKLIEKDFAYESEGDVYFRVRKFEDYGKLSGQSIEKMLEGVRIDPGEKKNDPLDFALWKKSKENEPHWDSPWGQGRPGWHIECSAMSMKHLGCETLDIHAGGRDLIFPHHENEVAQSEALTGKPFAKYWIHHGLLTINSQKMAKSLGNFITIQDAIKKYGADALKLFFLSSHYGSNIDFSDEKIEDIKKGYERIAILVSELRKLNTATSGTSKEVASKRAEFEEAMDDDFNTPKALAVLFDVVHLCNKLMDSSQDDKNLILKAAMEFIDEVSAIFLLNFDLEINDESLKNKVEALLSEREQARANRDFKRSDEIRDQLTQMGIVVEDGKDGQRWRKM